MAATEIAPPEKMVLSPISAVTWAPTVDWATATPTAPPPTETPIALLDRLGVIDADTSVPTPVADVVIVEPEPISAVTLEFSCASASAPTPATIPPPSAVAVVVNVPAPCAPTASVEVLMLAPCSTLPRPSSTGSPSQPRRRPQRSRR